MFAAVAKCQPRRGDASPLCRDCRADVGLIVPSQDTATAPPLVRVRSSFVLTQVIVGINVLVFIGMLLTGVSPLSPRPVQLVMWGANFAPLSLGSQPWRMLASNYVHIGIIHIFFNMWCLWNLGQLAERIFDRWSYLLVYTASGIAGSLASLWWHPQGIGAGASGAIFGLAGGLIAVLYLGKLPIAKEALKPTLRSLIMFRRLQPVLRPGARYRQLRSSWRPACWPGDRCGAGRYGYRAAGHPRPPP